MKKAIIFKTLLCSSFLLISSSAFAETNDYSVETSGLATFFALITFVAAVLQIILFYKIWIMTNDIKEIRNQYIRKDANLEDAVLPYLFGRKDEALSILNLSMEKKIRECIDTGMSPKLINTEIEEIDNKYYKAFGIEMPSKYKEFNKQQYNALFKGKKETGSQEGAKPSQTSSNS